MNTPVLIVGSSGSGKSSTFRDLDPDKTVILNAERKSLPFRSFKKFKNIDVSRYKDFKAVMKELKISDKYDTVVIDSLTSLLEIINKYCTTVYSGYSVWGNYNDMIYELLQDMKDLPQQVFMTAIQQYTPDLDNPKAFAKVKGKEWLYSIEKEFAIVLHTDLLDDDEGNITEYRLDTSPSKHTSAKSPNGMFEERYIPNDAVTIKKAIDAYYED